MRTLDSWDDAFGAGELVAGIDGFVVIDGEHLLTSLLCKVGMHGANAGIIKTCRDGEGLFNLSVVGLHNQCAGTVNNAFGSAVNGGSRVIGVNAVTACLGQYNLYTVIVDIMIDGAG